MYESFYDFYEKPFSLLPDHEFLYLSEKHEAALNALQYGLMNMAGFTVITGEIGSGKTTLIRRLLNCVDDDLTMGLVTNPHPGFGSLLQWIALAYGLDYKGKENIELYDDLTHFFISQYAIGKRVVLIVDEAQNLDPKTLEELRLISNINSDKDHILQVILVGQPELWASLNMPELEQFNQRIAIHYHLDSLSMNDVQFYIQHRLKCAGGNENLFDEKAISLIAYYSQGIPRIINNFSELALVYGFADGAEFISEEIVLSAIKDKTNNSDIKAPPFIFEPVTCVDDNKVTDILS